MKIVRQRSPDRFTVLDNTLIESRAIPYRALGLITYLLSRPDGWETDSNDLARSADDPSDAREGRDAVRTALRHLQGAGYLKREKVQDRRTGLWSTVTAIVDQVAPTPRKPSSVPTPRKPTVGQPVVGFLGAKNPSTDPKHGSKALEVDVDQNLPPAVTGPRCARPEEAVENVDELCAELRVIRREEGLPVVRWTDKHIRRSIGRSLEAGYPPEAIPDAYRALARDPDTQTPGRGPHDGPWWTAVEADMLRRRRLDQAAHARRAAAAAEQRRRDECTRCDADGVMQTLHGPARCDHIPDDETETA